MRFVIDTFRILRDTAWPNRKQRWTDFWSVLQYSAFFILVIFLFDQAVSRVFNLLLDFFQ